MKKLVMAILLCLGNSGIVHALPIGNPAEPTLFTNGTFWDGSKYDFYDPRFAWCDVWSIRLGFYGDYVYNRNLEVTSRGDDVDRTLMYTNAGYAALNFYNKFDVFGTVGVTRIRLEGDNIVWGLIDPAGVNNVESEIHWQTAFSWSVGARAVLWECDCFFIGAEGQYFQTKPNFDYWSPWAPGATTIIVGLNTIPPATYQEWQVGLGAAYRVQTLTPKLSMVPYLGVKLSRVRLKMNNFVFTGAPFTLENETLRNLESKKLWGYAFGMTFSMCDAIGVTVEGRWGDEKALYVNGQLRF